MYVAGAWELDPARRELRAQGRVVPIGGRAFDLLEVLVRSAEQLVTKDQLISEVWPGAVVEENTLHVHMTAIRRALGPGRDMLKTHSGRGYRLLGNWRARTQAASTRACDRASAQRDHPAVGSNLPIAADKLIGRSAVVQHLTDLLSAYRIVTLTGMGGIGKTRIALEAARLLLPGYAGNVFWVELAPLSDGTLVFGAIATVLGLAVQQNALSVELLARAVGGRRLLLVIDNCEHLIDHAANAVENIIRFCPSVSVLATSRELLRVEGECAYRVPPLDVPAPGGARLPDSGAIRLFVARMMEQLPDVPPESLAAIAAICRRLDGIPLAIEFAAARAAVIGVGEVLSRLDDRFALLTSGRRTALPKQRTLRATLDWSYQLLTDQERWLLERVAVFAGSFSLDAAHSVAAVAGATVVQTAQCLGELVGKSLIVSDSAGPRARFRLLETIRVYALEQLSACGAREQIARHHAQYYRDLFLRAAAEVLARNRSEWLADYAREIDNVRAALDWAFLPGGGDVSVGIALTAAAEPLWAYLSLIEECRGRVEQALAALAAAAADARVEMKLQAALATSLGQTGGAGTEIDSAWVRALDLAECLRDVDYQLRALWGLWQIRDRGALAVAEQFAAAASTPADRLTGYQMVGHSQHIRGDQASARRHLEHVIANNDAIAISGPRVIRFHLDQQPLGALARVLWLQGLPEKAEAMAERLVERAKTRDHAHSLCNDLALAACRIALRIGNLDLAKQYIDLLNEVSSRHGLTLWHALGRAHRGVLLIRQGDLPAGLTHLRDVFEQRTIVPPGYRVLDFVAELADALGRSGEAAKGLKTVGEAINRAERTAEGWIVPELLRVKGELVRLGGAPEAGDSAEACFRDALQLASGQGALSWELRAAASLARLLRDRHRYADAMTTLRLVYDRFTEGFETADLKQARALLSALRLRL